MSQITRKPVDPGVMIRTADGKGQPRMAPFTELTKILAQRVNGGGAGGGSGNVVGPASAVDGDFVQFDGTSGKLIKDGGLSLDTDGTLAANSDLHVPSQKAVKTYADTKLTKGLTLNHIWVGNASNLAVDVAMSGDATIVASGALTLANTAVTPASYGDATHVASFTVDSKGRLTAASNVLISAGTVSTTGSPASGNLTKFSGATSITNGDLSGDVSTSGTLVVTIKTDIALPGNPTTTTQAAGNSSTRIATTAFVAGAGSQILDGLGSAQGDIAYRNASAWVVLAPSTAGFVLSTNGAAANPSWIAATAVTAPTDADLDFMFFGTGMDGAVSLSSSVTTLTRDMYYSDLTLSGTAQINTSGFKIYVSGTLDLTNAPANAIISLSQTAATKNGTNASTTAGAAGGTAPVIRTVGGGSAGGTGGNGGTTTGTQAANQAASGNQLANISGSGGKGGTGPSGAGGASRAGNAGVVTFETRRLTTELYGISNSSVTYTITCPGAPGGSGGGGDGVGTGGGGGGGGASGATVLVSARTIARGGSTAARAINTDGGNGGNGGTGTGGTNTGGGGGGASGGGGWVVLIYRLLTGSTATSMLSATGGAGGNGGTGRGTGIGGDGGGAGSRGRIDAYNLAAGTWTHVDTDTSVVAGNAGSGTTGGTGATANTQFMSI